MHPDFIRTQNIKRAVSYLLHGEEYVETKIEFDLDIWDMELARDITELLEELYREHIDIMHDYVHDWSKKKI